MLVGLLTLASLTGAITAPPAPQRYRIEVKAQQEVDATAVGGGKQSTDLGIIGFITVTMSDTTGGQLAHIVVDSLTFPAGMEPPMGITDGPETAKGIYFHGYILDGKVKGGLKPSTPHQLVALLAGGVEGLFPGLRATAKVGDNWTDTVKTDNTTEGTTQTSTTIIAWKATPGAGGMLRYEGTSTGTMMREGPGPNGKQTINAKISGTRWVHGPALGPMLHGEMKSLQDVLVLIEGMTDAIPVTANTTVTISILP